NFSCPVCRAHDRERHLFMYLQSLNIFEQFRDASILHFAPDRQLSKILLACQPPQYLRADLFPMQSDIQEIDIARMPFESNVFDFLIANHVLEHVQNLPDALSEIRRVLKVGGFAILQTPYSNRLRSTWEDAGIDDEATRLQAYGQED